MWQNLFQIEAINIQEAADKAARKLYGRKVFAQIYTLGIPGQFEARQQFDLFSSTAVGQPFLVVEIDRKSENKK